MEIEVKIRGLMMDPNSGTPIIILKDVNSETMLPIWVGAYEANAIALEIEKVAPQRPMTHDLLRNLVVQMGLRIERVIVTELKDNTFFAVIEMRDASDETVLLDARPSDAIALALRADCPIFVDEAVLKASRNSAGAAAVAAGGSGGDPEDVGDADEEWPDVIGEAGDLPM